MIRPPTQSEDVGLENELSRAPGRKYSQCNHPCDEEDQMCDTSDDFDRSEKLASKYVDSDRYGEDSPGQEGSVPSMEYVSGIVENHQALNAGAEEKGRLRTGCDPCADSDPTLHETPESW